QDSGMIPLRLVPVTLSELLAEVVEEQQSIAIDKRLTLTMGSENSQAASDASDAAYTLSAYTQSAYTLSADRDQLTRLFTNLIGNAVQYTPQNGKIEVSLNRIKHQGNFCLQVKVHNTGIGIPADSIPHLFDRFYRVDPARSNSDPQNRHKAELTSGSGLGLAIAKVIVENHQGQIQVESPPSQGTTFTVILPVHRPE
ncbi:MAG TPA: ATP-binding protein, partial [Allocoleopsis sp.]